MKTWAKARVPYKGIEYRVVENDGRWLLQIVWSDVDDHGRHEHRKTLAQHESFADAMDCLPVAVRTIWR